MPVTDNQIQAAFNRAVRDITQAARFNPLRDAIARGDYQAAINAVDVDEAAFDDMRGLLLRAYAEAGVNEITGRRWDVPVRYNSASPYAERHAREVVGQHITLIAEDSRDAIRHTMGDGIAFGRSNNRIALDIVGRVGADGRRHGGVVGLNRGQAEWVANARRYLEEGDTAAYLRMTRRDRRFDAMVMRGDLTAAQIDRIVGRYSDRLLQTRGLTIARTERGSAVNIGKMDAWRQAADRVGIPHSALVKTWRHGVASEPRMWHLEANGDSVVGLDTPFTLGNGAALQCPHDPFASASEVVNCTCRLDISLPKGWRNG